MKEHSHRSASTPHSALLSLEFSCVVGTHIPHSVIHLHWPLFPTPPAPHTSPMGTHHTYYIHLLSRRMEYPQLCLTSRETPLSSALPCPFFSQVVFPHHWPHGHLHIHRSHSGLCWPLLRVGEFPILRPLEGSEAPMEDWPILPAGSLPMSLVSRVQLPHSPGPGPLLRTSVLTPFPLLLPPGQAGRAVWPEGVLSN